MNEAAEGPSQTPDTRPGSSTQGHVRCHISVLLAPALLSASTLGGRNPGQSGTAK